MKQTHRFLNAVNLILKIFKLQIERIPDERVPDEHVQDEALKDEKIYFSIMNYTELDIIITHEPEAIDYSLPYKENIFIECNPIRDNIGLSISLYKGQVVVQLWDAIDTDYRVFHNERDVFEDLL